MNFKAGAYRIALYFFTLLSACHLHAQDLAAKADAYLQKQAATKSFRGVALIGVNGKIEFERGYGFASEELRVQNTPQTKFRIASLTKQFTAACVLLLQEQGKLNVHDQISKYLPGLPAAWQAITIHQLLTHTSGMPNYTEFPPISQLNLTGATPQAFIAVVADKQLLFPPGTKFSYTNTGYVLLGMLIEKVSGQHYADFLRGKIFTPLGMNDSGYDTAAAILPLRAAGYQLKDGMLVNAQYIDMTVPFAAGGIYSTVEDLFKWNEALAHGKLLSEASQELMFGIYPETGVNNSHYGYGVVMTERFSQQLYYHGGGVSGFASSIQRYPAKNLCIVVLSNLEIVKPWEIGDGLAEMRLK